MNRNPLEGVPNAGVDLTVTCPKCGHVGPSVGGWVEGGVMALLLPSSNPNLKRATAEAVENGGLSFHRIACSKCDWGTFMASANRVPDFCILGSLIYEHIENAARTGKPSSVGFVRHTGNRLEGGAL